MLSDSVEFSNYLSGFVELLVLFGEGLFRETVSVIYVLKCLNNARPEGAGRLK